MSSLQELVSDLIDIVDKLQDRVSKLEKTVDYLKDADYRTNQRIKLARKILDKHMDIKYKPPESRGLLLE